MPINLPAFTPSVTEIGRIRLGDKQKLSGGKTRPNKLSNFRLTSPHKDALEAAAALYGGEVRPWNDKTANPPNQFELYTDASALRVVIPSVLAFEQWLEKWDAGGCVIRTDGNWDYIANSEYTGPTTEEGMAAIQLKPVTRLSVMLEGVPGFGVWRVESHGFYAAKELAAAVLIIEAAGLIGRFAAGELRLVERQVKRRQPDGKVLTKRFPVPELFIRATPEELAAGAAHVSALQSGELLALERPVDEFPDIYHEPNTFDPENPFDMSDEVAVTRKVAKHRLVAAAAGDKGVASAAWKRDFADDPMMVPVSVLDAAVLRVEASVAAEAAGVPERATETDKSLVVTVADMMAALAEECTPDPYALDGDDDVTDAYALDGDDDVTDAEIMGGDDDYF